MLVYFSDCFTVLKGFGRAEGCWKFELFLRFDMGGGVVGTPAAQGLAGVAWVANGIHLY